MASVADAKAGSMIAQESPVQRFFQVPAPGRLSKSRQKRNSRIFSHGIQKCPTVIGTHV